jgi:HSP20 family protein
MFNTILSHDIRQTLDHFRRSVDQLFNEAYSSPSRGSSEGNRQDWSFSPVLETAWTGNEVCVRAILPGVSQNDVSVNLRANQLVIEGERRRPKEFDDNAWTQLKYGKFSTAITLPSGLDADKIECRLHDGVLDIRVPVAETMKPRQIQIETGERQKSLGA